MPIIHKAIINHLPSAWRRFANDQRGGIALFLGFAIVPLVCFIGIGFDTARAYMVKSKLGSAVDAAGLAGGVSYYLPTRDDDIRMYFDANYPPGFLGSTVDGPYITVEEAEEKLEIDASATVQTTFMRLLGHDSITVSAEAEVTRKMSALDVVLAIDVSGSMNNGSPSRLDSAKSAANEMVDLLFGVDTTEEFLYIGLVPWGAKVNVMTEGTAYNWANTTTVAVPGFINPETGAAQNEVYYPNNSQVPLLSPPPQNWDGCVFNRYIDNGTDDDDGDIRYGTFSGGGADWPAWQPVLPGTDLVFGGEPISPGRCQMSINNEECTPCPPSGITPLQNTKAAIEDAVDALEANGYTNIPAGLGWAWRVLMPTAPYTEAILNPDYDREQAIVLLTDGENCARSGDGYKRVFGGCSGGRDEMNDRLRLLADSIKADGVIIYVIQFANQGTALQNLLKEVASGPDAPYYHYAPSGDDLRNVFRQIANHLSILRLSK